MRALKYLAASRVVGAREPSCAKPVVEESSMATTAVSASPEPQPSMSAMARIFGVFFSPKNTFADVVRKPSWIVPIVVLTLFSLSVSFSLNQRVDWRQVASERIEKSSRASQPSPEQKEQQLAVSAKISPAISYGFGLLGPILGALVIALIMMGAYNLMSGAGVNYGTSLAITSHAFVPGLLSSLIFLLVLWVRPPGTIDLENPVATNIAAVLPEGTAPWLLALCKNIDVFTFWTLILIAMGFAAASPKKLKGGKAFTIAFSALALWIVLRVGWAFIWS
jgi:Yip1 domain